MVVASVTYVACEVEEGREAEEKQKRVDGCGRESSVMIISYTDY
jgi:hypothetical protein